MILGNKFLSENTRYVLKQGFFIKSLLLILVNGFSRTSLEIIRLSIQKKLVKKYSKKIKKLNYFDDNTAFNFKNKTNHQVIWVCWLQGIENAPPLVQKCYETMTKLEDKVVVNINSSNYHEYVNLPDYIIDKWKDGRISNTHFSDLLRVELLYQHGGIWLDATVYCSSLKLPNYLENSWLFFYQVLKPGANGHSIVCSSWAMSSIAKNPVLELVRHVLFDYWKKSNELEDYFLLHIVISAILQVYPRVLDGISNVCNSSPHLLQLEMLNNYCPTRIEEIKSLSSIHKLTYKYDAEKISSDETILSHLLSSKVF